MQMKRLSKSENEERESFVRNLKEKAGEITEAVAKINALISGELAQAVTEYNAIVAEAEEWRNELTGRMEDYVSERSEKWQEGEAAENYNAWKDSWESIPLEELQDFEEIDFEEPDTDEFEQAASEPES